MDDFRFGMLGISDVNVWTSMFMLIIFLCCIAPSIRTFLLLLAQSKGEKVLVSQKIKWSFSSIIIPPLLFLLFCLAVPFTSSYMLGDIYIKAGDLDQSEHYYQKALKKNPGNIDVLFEIGVLYNEKGNHELAFSYLKEAYLKDPSYWLAEAAVFIPETLINISSILSSTNSLVISFFVSCIFFLE